MDFGLVENPLNTLNALKKIIEPPVDPCSGNARITSVTRVNKHHWYFIYMSAAKNESFSPPWEPHAPITSMPTVM